MHCERRHRRSLSRSMSPTGPARTSRGPRIRTVKPDCWQDEAVGQVSRDARLLFLGLISQADDKGRQRGSLALLRSLIYPYDCDLPLDSIRQWLTELAAVGLVELYEHDDRAYIHLPGFTANQKIDKPSDSRWPEPPNSANDRRMIGERSRTVAPEGKGTVEDRSAVEQPRVRATAEAGLHPALADVLAIAQEAAAKRSDVLVSPESVDLVLRNYPHADHLMAAREAAADFMAGIVNKPQFHNWLKVKLAYQKPRPKDDGDFRARQAAALDRLTGGGL